MNSCDETKDEEEEKEGEEDEEGRCVPDGEDYEAKTEACTAMTKQRDCEAWQGTSGRNEDNCKWKSGEQSGGDYPPPPPTDEPWWTRCKEAYEQCKADTDCKGGMDKAEQEGTCVLPLSVFRPC